MTEHYDLSKIFTSGPMHDQRVSSVELKADELIFHIPELKKYEPLCGKARIYCEEHSSFESCDIIFKGVGKADLLAEVKTRTGDSFKGELYYDEEFINFLNEHQYSVELIDMCCGYMKIVIEAALVDKSGAYCEENCVITITSNEMIYHWS